jgi:hypothetical protein
MIGSNQRFQIKKAPMRNAKIVSNKGQMSITCVGKMGENVS